MLHVIWKYFNAYNFESGPILQHSSHIVHQWWNLHISNSVSHAVRVTDTKKPPRSYRRTSSLIIHFQRKHTQDFAGFCILALIIYSSFPPPQKKKAQITLSSSVSELSLYRGYENLGARCSLTKSFRRCIWNRYAELCAHMSVLHTEQGIYPLITPHPTHTPTVGNAVYPIVRY